MMKVAAAMIVAAVLVAGPSGAAQQTSSADASPVDSAGVKKLTRRERSRIIASFSPVRKAQWLRLAPVLTDAERDAFLGLDDEVRDDWVAKLHSDWGIDEPALETRYRAALALLGEIDPDDPASRLAMLRGAPSERILVRCPQLVVPAEVWSWNEEESVLLYQSDRKRLVFAPEKEDTHQDGSDDPRTILLSQRGRRLGALPVFDGIPGAAPLVSRCDGGDAVIGALDQDFEKVRMLLTRRRVEPANDRSGAVMEPVPESSPLTTSISFPGKRGSRTSVEWTVLIPDGVVEPASQGDYELDVEGKIANRAGPVETFRYRYTRPAGEALQVSFERYLVPDDYTYRLVVRDGHGWEVVGAGKVDVPYIAPPPDSAQRWSDDRNERIVAFEQDYREGESRIRLIQPEPGIMVGPQRFDTVVSGDAIRSVEFELDGRKIMTRRRPPFTIELNLGELPTMRKVRVTARDDSGRVVAGDEIIVNAGLVPFRVQIVSPRVSEGIHGEVRAEVGVDVPRNRELDRVELYLNDRHIATGFESTFVQRVDLGAEPRIGYLRAKAVLADEAGTVAEDVVFLNAPHLIEQVDVRLVEIPVTAVRSGRPVPDLEATDFSLREEGEARAIEKFERVKNLPLSVGLAVDNSGSMANKMDDVLKAAAKFFERVLEAGDKAFVVSFNDEAKVVQPWTDELSGLHAGLSTLEAEDMTALYDAVITSLYNFQGLEGQKALVVLTDGADTSSQFSLAQTVEFARRTRVPIYVIAVGFDSRDSKVRAVVHRLARETGGDSWFIQRAGDLSDIYDKIEEELRSQYILGFYPGEGAAAEGEFRRIEVESKRADIRTIAGYYP